MNLDFDKIKIGFVGGGNMAQAIAEGLVKKGPITNFLDVLNR